MQFTQYKMSGLIHSGVQEINELSETNSNDVHTRTKYSQAQTQAGKVRFAIFKPSSK